MIYRIVKDSQVLAYTDTVRYVKDNNGVFVQCSKSDATHVAVNGEPYQVSEVFITEIDGGEITFNTARQVESSASDITDLQELVVNMEYDSIVEDL